MAVDEELARHCLHPQLLGREHLMCPVQVQRDFARTPHEACEGRSPLEQFQDWLDAVCFELEHAEGKARKARLRGQRESLAAVIAVLTHPYNPDPNRVLMEATRRIES